MPTKKQRKPSPIEQTAGQGKLRGRQGNLCCVEWPPRGRRHCSEIKVLGNCGKPVYEAAAWGSCSHSGTRTHILKQKQVNMPAARMAPRPVNRRQKAKKTYGAAGARGGCAAGIGALAGAGVDLRGSGRHSTPASGCACGRAPALGGSTEGPCRRRPGLSAGCHAPPAHAISAWKITRKASSLVQDSLQLRSTHGTVKKHAFHAAANTGKLQRAPC